MQKKTPPLVVLGVEISGEGDEPWSFDFSPGVSAPTPPESLALLNLIACGSHFEKWPRLFQHPALIGFIRRDCKLVYGTSQTADWSLGPDRRRWFFLTVSTRYRFDMYRMWIDVYTRTDQPEHFHHIRNILTISWWLWCRSPVDHRSFLGPFSISAAVFFSDRNVNV